MTELGTDTFAAESQAPAVDAPAAAGTETNAEVDTFAAETADANTRTTEGDAASAASEADGKPAEKPAGDEASQDVKPVEGETAAVEYGEFTLPEGREMDTDSLNELLPIAKEHGLPQEAVQKFIDIADGMIGKVEAAQNVMLDEQVKTWDKEWHEDPEIGGLKYDKSLAQMNAAIDRFGPEGLRELLEETQFIKHPKLGKLLANIGAAISEDQIVNSMGRSEQSYASKKEKFYAQEN